MPVRYDRLPDHMRDGARLYIERGVRPGDFLHAVLTDSLTEAYARADHINTEAMQRWAQWLYSDCPRPAWGSHAAIDAWMERGGLQGRASTPSETDGTAPNAAERTTARRVDPA